MHAEYLHTESPADLGFRRNMKLFSEGGISPTGECWVSPTAVFLRLWHSSAGVHLKKQGILIPHKLLQNNGKEVGASQDRILICPRQKK